MLYGEVFKEFQKQKVRYTIVGGLALNLLGVFRGTADLDILVEMSDENLAKIVKILTKRGYRVKQPVDPMGIADARTRNSWIKSKYMRAFNFYNEKEFKEVDIIISSPVSFREAIKTAKHIKSGNLTLFVMSVDNLIKMKKKANRAIDKVDIDQLKRIKKLT
ncbi:MAG: hypothetical protein PHY46_04900 [Candidatus Omnitrophica bacterium]|nr:hypothetical protein [Candidatus Omnitrophota bacterium]MDD5356201.1 hypothetical protein [Candidatus Omnitrophota bacterium]